MSTDDDDQEDRLLAAKAAEWIERLTHASPKDREAFWAWVERSPHHVEETLLAMILEEVLRETDFSKGIDLDELISTSDTTVVPMAPSGFRNDTQDVAASREFADESAALARLSPHARPAWLPRIGVSIVLVVLSGLATMLAITPTPRLLSTDSGQWRGVHLPDGSFAQLGPNTQLWFDFSGQTRSVRLSHGEVLFEVSKDVARPFVVETSLAAAHAVGTGFAVSTLADDGRDLVTVREGIVAVHRTAEVASGAASIQAMHIVSLAAGQQVSVDGSSAALQVKNVDLDRELAWARRRLIVHGTLASAVKELNRRNALQIIIADPLIGGVQLHGEFDAGDVEAFARILRTTRIVSVATDQHGSYVIARAPGMSDQELLRRQER